MIKEWYSIKEVSNLTGLSKEAIKSRIKRGTISYALIEGSRMVSIEEVQRLLATPESQASPLITNKVIADANAILRNESPSETEEDKVRRSLVESEANVRELKRLLASYNERSRLEDRIEQKVAHSLANNPYAPRLTRPVYEPGVSNGDHEMLLLVSDAHFPEVVNPDEALGIQYGPEVVRRRMEYIADRVKRLYDLHTETFPVRKLTIAVLGDMLSGNIHEELEITNAFPMGDALVEMAYMLYDMGSILSESVPVEMIIMPGNHPRMTKKPRNKQKWDNFEYIMGKMVQALASDTFEVVVPKDIVYAHNIFDWQVGFTHGDGSKAASFAGIPFYGLKQRSQANQAMRSTLGLDRLYMLCMGHYHQHLIWTEGDCHIVINGAIKGGDEYSIVTRSSATQPVQALLTFHEDRGHINTERIPLEGIV